MLSLLRCGGRWHSNEVDGALQSVVFILYILIIVTSHKIISPYKSMLFYGGNYGEMASNIEELLQGTYFLVSLHICRDTLCHHETLISEIAHYMVHCNPWIKSRVETRT
jgi:predicted RNase H-related nuclease YkuK (DUF458 family)